LLRRKRGFFFAPMERLFFVFNGSCSASLLVCFFWAFSGRFRLFFVGSVGLGFCVIVSSFFGAFFFCFLLFSGLVFRGFCPLKNRTNASGEGVSAFLRC